jgi:hypothetical protein
MTPLNMVMSPEGLRLNRALLMDHRVELLRRSALMSGLGEEALRSVAHHLHGETFTRGRAVQVHPVKSKLKSSGAQRLKLKCDEPLSDFAFNFNLRHFSEEP